MARGNTLDVTSSERYWKWIAFPTWWAFSRVSPTGPTRPSQRARALKSSGASPPRCSGVFPASMSLVFCDSSSTILLMNAFGPCAATIRLTSATRIMAVIFSFHSPPVGSRCFAVRGSWGGSMPPRTPWAFYFTPRLRPAKAPRRG